MKIAIIGTGYVGLVSGACFAEMGHQVICVDKVSQKIEVLNSGGIPIFEPGLKKIVSKNKQEGRLSFTLNIGEAINGANAVFIAVGTPPHPETGHADMKYVHAAAKEIVDHIDDFTVIVTKSTVPVGTGQSIERMLKKIAPEKKFSVTSNPEFLREGAAIGDFMKPDRIVVGTTCENSKSIMRAIYSPLTDSGFPLLFTTRESAELIKYASNAFLATKIGFINEMADLCEKVGGDVSEVARGMGLDNRIGGKFLNAGPGYGGSCFPKDTLALIKTGEDNEVPMQVVRSVIKSNENRKFAMANKIIDACGGTIEGKKIAVLGLTFKANTDDIRDAPSLCIIPELLKAGAKINVYDPEGMNEAKTHFGETLKYCNNAIEATNNVDTIVVLTEWQEFIDMTFDFCKSQIKFPNIIDLRNCLDWDKLTKNGFLVTRIGKPQ